MTIINDLISPARHWLDQDRLRRIKILAVSGVLLLSAYVVPRIAIGSRRYLIFLFLYIGIMGFLVLARWPGIGFIFLLLGGFFTTYEGPGGFNASQIILAAIIIVWFLQMIVVRRRIQFAQSRVMRPLIMFLLVSFLAFGIGQLPWYSFANNAPIDAQFGGLAIFLLSAGAFLAVANLIKDQKWLERMTWIFVLLGGIFIAGQLLGSSGGFITRWYQQSVASGSMFWTWLVAITFSQVLINNRLKIGWRILLGALSIATLYVAYFRYGDWKSGYLPALAAIGTIILLRYWKIARFGLLLVVIPAYDIANQAIATDQYSWSTRLEAWFIVSEIARASPILGLGFANYYWYTPFFPIRGYFVRFNSHSQYVDLFAQAGILGLTVFIWIFIEIARLGLGLRKRVEDGFQSAYVYGALGGLVATLVAAALVDWVLPFAYNIGLNGFRASVLPWLFLGGLVSLEQIIHRKNAEE